MMGDTKPADILAILPEPKTRIESYTAGKRVLFWSGSKKEQGKTTLVKLARHAMYKQVTVRNHNTAFKLRDLF